MEDEDQTEDSTSPVEVDVQVTVPETVDEPATETPSVIVVEDNNDSAVEAVLVEEAIENAGDLARVETIATLALETAQQALAMAELATVVAAEEPEPAPVIIEEPAPEPEEDSAPNNEHWWFK